MKDLIITLAQDEDAFDLADRLRSTDLDELEASSGEEPLEILREAIDISTHCWAARRAGHTQVLFGVAPLVDGMGSAWLLASNDLYSWPKEFIRFCHIYLAEMHESYPVLTNFVDDRNAISQAWLKRLGFKPGMRIPDFGVGKLPFTQFTSVRL